MAKPPVTLEGVRYVWTGTRWYGANDHITPPLMIIAQLNALIADLVREEDDAITDPDELLWQAKDAQEVGQLPRALRLAQRAYAARPGHAGTAAVLSSVLRDLHRPKEAWAVADCFTSSNYPPILTSRAAALCDLGRWEEALRQTRQVLAINFSSHTKSEEALGVYARIKANASWLL